MGSWAESELMSWEHDGAHEPKFNSSNFTASVLGEQPMRTSRVFRAVGLAAVLLYPMIFLGHYAGDAQIHLVFGESAARGDFFNFNYGEAASGETSPGFMLVLAVLYRAVEATWVPLVVKGLVLAAWYAHILLVYLLARRVIGSKRTALAAALVAGLLPGSAYNGTNGMENVLFTVLVILTVYLVSRWSWLTTTSTGTGRDLAIGILLGLGGWLRPEGIVVGTAMIAHRMMSVRPATKQWLPAALLPFLALTTLLVWFHWHFTGDLLPASGRSRVHFGTDLHLGPLPLSGRFLLRLVYYFPLTAFFVVGNALLLRRVSKATATPFAEPRCAVLLVGVSWLFFIGYSTVLGGAHLGRYIMFIMPMIIIVAAAGARWAWLEWPGKWFVFNTRGARTTTFALAAIVLGAVFAVETRLRYDLGSPDELWRTLSATADRKAHSDKLLATLGRPQERPVVIAVVEAQRRYWLDERFVVRSLDGAVDARLFDFMHQGRIDHVGYLKARKVAFLGATPNYNRDPRRWSLADLSSLRPGQTVTSEGLMFGRLAEQPQWFRLRAVADPPVSPPKRR